MARGLGLQIICAHYAGGGGGGGGEGAQTEKTLKGLHFRSGVFVGDGVFN